VDRRDLSVQDIVVLSAIDRDIPVVLEVLEPTDAVEDCACEAAEYIDEFPIDSADPPKDEFEVIPFLKFLFILDDFEVL